MRRLRNCNVTTVAPTGTISIIAGCSSGIEPLFAVAFMRNQAGVLMPDVNEDFVAIAKAEGWYSEDLMRRIAEAGHIDFPEVPAKWQRVFVTANHIKPEWHIRMQAAFQEYNDSAISKTCNFANDATEEYVEEIYRLAYRLELQGRHGLPRRQPGHAGAVHRLDRQEGAGAGDRERARPRRGPISADGRASRATAAELHGELAELEAENERLRRMVHELEAENLQRRQKRSRPELLRGATRRLETPLGTLYVTITEDDRGQPFEVFMSLGKAGGALMADVEALGRLISLALRSGIPIKEIYRQLRGISSDRVIGLGPEQDPVGARCGRHRDRALDAGEAGHPAGAAARARRAGLGRRSGGGPARRRSPGSAASRWCSAACRRRSPGRAPTAARSSSSPRGA